jgi:GTP cyclohydrolase II
MTAARETPATFGTADATLPTPYGVFRCRTHESQNGTVHLVLTLGDISAGRSSLVRIHSECLTGDVFGSLRCDCGAQLHEALQAIARSERGVLIYLRAHEGRGIGLAPKLQAYRLQDGGFDTVDANLSLGYPIDARDYSDAVTILRGLGVSRVRLMTNNPAKVDAMLAGGLACSRVPLLTETTDHNRVYMATKQRRLGHWLESADAVPGGSGGNIVSLPNAAVNRRSQ